MSTAVETTAVDSAQFLAGVTVAEIAWSRKWLFKLTLRCCEYWSGQTRLAGQLAMAMQSSPKVKYMRVARTRKYVCNLMY